MIADDGKLLRVSNFITICFEEYKNTFLSSSRPPGKGENTLMCKMIKENKGKPSYIVLR